MPEKQSKTFGIAHHSPLDVDALIPVGLRAVLQTNEIGEVLYSITPQRLDGTPIKYQFVFASAKDLDRWQVRKIDCNSKGGLIRLTSKALDYIMNPPEPSRGLLKNKKVLTQKAKRKKK